MEGFECVVVNERFLPQQNEGFWYGQSEELSADSLTFTDSSEVVTESSEAVKAVSNKSF
jgi:hypothetical protein